MLSTVRTYVVMFSWPWLSIICLSTTTSISTLSLWLPWFFISTARLFLGRNLYSSGRMKTSFSGGLGMSEYSRTEDLDCEDAICIEQNRMTLYEACWGSRVNMIRSNLCSIWGWKWLMKEKKIVHGNLIAVMTSITNIQPFLLTIFEINL